MLKHFSKILVFSLLLLVFAVPLSHATEPDNLQDASFQSSCDWAKQEEVPYPACATSPAECASKRFTEGTKNVWREPLNCIFIQEPIGGKTGYDLYKRVPNEDLFSPYILWHGESIDKVNFVGNTKQKESGPFQAILTFEEGKEEQGPFGLLYNYLGLVYNFLSGLIVGFVILITIVGGIRITIAGGDKSKYDAGKDMIIKALVGMILWFTASVILYTINPTFFTF